MLNCAVEDWRVLPRLGNFNKWKCGGFRRCGAIGISGFNGGCRPLGNVFCVCGKLACFHDVTCVKTIWRFQHYGSRADVLLRIFRNFA